MKQEMPLVNVIIVNYDGKAFLRDCFDSVYNLDYPKNKLEIIMVDNGSSDGSLDYVKKQFPAVKIIINNENNYTKANNLGIKAARGQYIGLINNDVKVDKGWLAELVKTINADNKIGAAGSKILFMDGTIQSVGHHEYPGFYWGDIGFREEDKGQYNDKQEVASICGCSVLYRKECLDEVGLLDEDLNMFMEDVDMGIRCRKKGWKSIICPGSVIYHKFHSTIGSEANARHWQEVNRLLLIAKHWPEKLADALAGRGHFIIKDNIDSARDISEVIAKVSNKILKEHGQDMLDKLSPDLFRAVRNIYNFEKDHLVQEVKDKNKIIYDKDREISAKDEELSLKDEHLSSLRQEKDQDLASLRQEMQSLSKQKDREISAKDEELSLKDEHLSSLRQELEQEIESLSKQKDREISAKDEELSLKDEQLSSLRQELEQIISAKDQQLKLAEQERNSLFFLLNKTKQELQSIYTSTAYKYFLKPLWDFLWPIKQKFKRTKKNIKSFSRQLIFEVRNKEKVSIKKFPKIFSKINEIYHSLHIRGKWENIYINHIKYKTFPPNPERLTLMLNTGCNLKCAFCDIPNTDYREAALPKENAFKIIDEVKKIGVKEIILTGGEPFLHPHLFEIIDFANLRNINSVITTNGLFIKQYIDRIIKSGINCISVSIDGKEETHDFLRNHQGAYRQVIEAIFLLKQHKINTSVNFVITNKNITEIEDVHNLFYNLNIKVSFLPVINKPDLFPAKIEEKNTYMRFIKKLLRKNQISIYDYKYLEIAMLAYFSKKNLNVRCLGLNYELGIDTDGNIAPCCVWENRKPELNDLGNILETDIEELWYSAKFHQVRLSIFKEGCQNCFNPSIVDLPKITGINFLVPRRKEKKENLILATIGYKENISKPNHVHMRFTSRCNLSCRHCDIWKIDKDPKCEISVEDWKKCIDKLHIWLGSFKLDLAGGEVLLYYGTIPLIQHCASKGISVNLTTNATLIDDIMAEKIADSGLYCINLSLDGLENVHCYTRNNFSAFLKVQEATSRLLKYRKQDIPYISLATVITKYNLKQLPEIVKLTQKWNINNISFQVLDQNFGAKYDQNWFKENEFWPENFAELENVIDNLINMKKKGIRIDNSLEQLNAFKRYYKNPSEEINNPCFTAIKNFIVNEFGEVLLCWNMSPVANLLSDNPEQIWNSKSVSQMRKQIERCKRTCRMLNCNYA